ncbi:MAG: flavodoxin-dependent (E)-4-hydroxy-3-methylbut-2-enyl-diphosphate synthase [bacterium]|nr:flavodoxin-dependent (E)-4-hydroxy-3-methylbut-2-enyl-diphosphate synthase [bacterium]
MKRRNSRKIKVGNLVIGGNSPIIIQSMTKTDTKDLKATINQIKELEDVGCELVRVALVDKEAALCISKIKKEVKIPIIGDVHFSSEIAKIALEEGIDKIRLNPGNIRNQNKLKKVIILAKKLKVPIRIGVNAGSLNKKKYSLPTPKNLVSSALEYISFFEDLNFFDIIISLKACDIYTTIEAYKLMERKTDYPFHIGITEAGIPNYGLIKSAVGCGILAFLGLADTIRVSLTAPPVEEVIAAYQILKALSLRNYGPEIISCPTCGRCRIDLFPIVAEFNKELQKRYSFFKLNNLNSFKVALMGCEVNGPGEAKMAEVGIACGKSGAVLFKKGKIVRKIHEKEIIETLLEEIDRVI